LVADLSGKAATVRLGPAVRGSRPTAWVLDEHSVEEAMTAPEQFGTPRLPLAGDKVELGPYAVAVVEWSREQKA
jgi:hypothetical protein